MALFFGVLTLLLAPFLAVMIRLIYLIYLLLFFISYFLASSLPLILYWYLFIWRRDATWELPVIGVIGDR